MVSVNRPRNSVAFWVCTSRRRGFIICSYECLTSTSFWPMDVNSLDSNAADSVLDAHPLAPRFVREAMCNLLRSRPAIPVRTIHYRAGCAYMRRVAHPCRGTYECWIRALPALAITSAAAPVISLTEQPNRPIGRRIFSCEKLRGYFCIFHERRTYAAILVSLRFLSVPGDSRQRNHFFPFHRSVRAIGGKRDG